MCPLPWARRHAHVGKFKGWDVLGVENVNNFVVLDTCFIFNRVHGFHSSLNWHFPGGTTAYD